MRTVNLLDFLNKAKVINTLECNTCDRVTLDLFDFLSDEEQFVQKINLGPVYLKALTLDSFILVDGMQRLLSVSLLLHALCECYKKTSIKNDNAIEFVKNNYLICNGKMKLRLPEKNQIIYEKIINGERLSGKEKKSPLFIMLHKMWTFIKEEELQAASILKMLNKIYIILVEADDTPIEELFYSLNRNNRELNQYLLLDCYLKKYNLLNKWAELKNVFNNNSNDLNLFFKDFFVQKFNFKQFNENKLYDYFVNYFETLLQYYSGEEIFAKIIEISMLYRDILNVNFNDEELKKAFIQIKMHKGEDTYAYLLSIYEDYVENNITKATFLEILSTIDEYLVNRLKTPNEVSFNDLIKYLNAFITCK